MATAELIEAAEEQHDGDIQEAVREVRKKYQAVELHLTKIPQQRAVNPRQKQEALAIFGRGVQKVESRAVGMYVRLFDSQCPAVARLHEIAARIVDVYKSPAYTLPHPDRATRLILEESILEFEAEMTFLQAQYKAAGEAFVAELPVIVGERESELLELFDASAYQLDLANICGVDWKFKDVAVPSYLRRLDPQLAAKAEARLQNEIAECVRLKELEMAAHVHALCDHLAERLTLDETGARKVFRDATVSHVFSAIEEIERQAKDNHIGGQVLREAATALRGVVGGAPATSIAEQLREGPEDYRREIKEQFSAVADNLAELAVRKGRRKLLRDF